MELKTREMGWVERNHTDYFDSNLFDSLTKLEWQTESLSFNFISKLCFWKQGKLWRGWKMKTQIERISWTQIFQRKVKFYI
jgi:hypothetical protein